MKICGGWLKSLCNSFMTALEFITAALAIGDSSVDFMEFVKHIVMLLQFIVDLCKHHLEVVAAPLVQHCYFIKLLRFFYYWQKGKVNLLLDFCNWNLFTIVFVHFVCKFCVLFVSRGLLSNFSVLRDWSGCLLLFISWHSTFGFDKHFLKIKFLISRKIKSF